MASRGGQDRAGTAGNLVALARTMLARRASLETYVAQDLFADPALAMLLHLFCEDRPGTPVTTTACCAAAGVPRTTALRWIKLLSDRGLVVQGEDPQDRRITTLRLTDAARASLARWLEFGADR